MKHKKKSKKYGVGGSSNPLKDLNDMQFAKKGIAVGSYLEGGTIKYKNNGPGDPPKKGQSGPSIEGPDEIITVPTAAKLGFMSGKAGPNINSNKELISTSAAAVLGFAAKRKKKKK